MFVVIDEDRSCSVAAVVGSLVYAPSSHRLQQNNQPTPGARCGSKLNPWIVEAQTGQKINISLLDFGLQQLPRDAAEVSDQAAATDAVVRQTNDCTFHYGYILDKAATATNDRNITICATSSGLTRDRFVYQSKGSAVEIVLNPMQSDQGSNQYKFLLGFEGIYEVNPSSFCFEGKPSKSGIGFSLEYIKNKLSIFHLTLQCSVVFFAHAHLTSFAHPFEDGGTLFQPWAAVTWYRRPTRG